MTSNTERGSQFRAQPCRAVGRLLGVQFKEEVPLPVGAPPKYHRFDLVSTDGKFVGEAKAFTWTVAGNTPSAKITTLREAAQYLQLLPSGVRRFIVMAASHHPLSRRSLADYFVRLNGHLLGGIAVFELSEADDLRAAKDWDSLRS